MDLTAFPVIPLMLLCVNPCTVQFNSIELCAAKLCGSWLPPQKNPVAITDMHTRKNETSGESQAPDMTSASFLTTAINFNVPYRSVTFHGFNDKDVFLGVDRRVYVANC